MFYQTNHMQAAERAEKRRFSPVTLTFKLIRARDQTRLLCEFGTNQFSSSPRYFIHKQKKVTDSAKNRTLRIHDTAKNDERNLLYPLTMRPETTLARGHHSSALPVTGAPSMIASSMIPSQSTSICTQVVSMYHQLYITHFHCNFTVTLKSMTDRQLQLLLLL